MDWLRWVDWRLGLDWIGLLLVLLVCLSATVEEDTSSVRFHRGGVASLAVHFHFLPIHLGVSSLAVHFHFLPIHLGVSSLVIHFHFLPIHV